MCRFSTWVDTYVSVADAPIDTSGTIDAGYTPLFELSALDLLDDARLEQTLEDASKPDPLAVGFIPKNDPLGLDGVGLPDNIDIFWPGFDRPRPYDPLQEFEDSLPPAPVIPDSDEHPSIRGVDAPPLSAEQQRALEKIDRFGKLANLKAQGRISKDGKNEFNRLANELGVRNPDEFVYGLTPRELARTTNLWKSSIIEDGLPSPDIDLAKAALEVQKAANLVGEAAIKRRINEENNREGNRPGNRGSFGKPINAKDIEPQRTTLQQLRDYIRRLPRQGAPPARK